MSIPIVRHSFNNSIRSKSQVEHSRSSFGQARRQLQYNLHDRLLSRYEIVLLYFLIRLIDIEPHTRLAVSCGDKSMLSCHRKPVPSLNEIDDNLVIGIHIIIPAAIRTVRKGRHIRQEGILSIAVSRIDGCTYSNRFLWFKNPKFHLRKYFFNSFDHLGHIGTASHADNLRDAVCIVLFEQSHYHFYRIPQKRKSHFAKFFTGNRHLIGFPVDLHPGTHPVPVLLSHLFTERMFGTDGSSFDFLPITGILL